MADELPPPPDPPISADADLRDFTYMPIEIGRLFGSTFHAKATDSEWRAGVTLWLKSYHQMPAGSLPDDDLELCRLAELGRDIRQWRKIKTMALRGWTKCTDGRLYHPTVFEKVAEAWRRKEIQRERSKKGNQKRWRPNDASGGATSQPHRKGASSPDEIHSEGSGQGGGKDKIGSPSEVLNASLKDRKGEGREREGKGEGEGLESYGGADAPPAYAFVGKIIRLNQADFDQWRRAFPAIPDYVAELQAADAYYAEHAPKDGKWFFPVSNWLKKANREALDRKADPVEEQIYRGLD